MTRKTARPSSAARKPAAATRGAATARSGTARAAAKTAAGTEAERARPHRRYQLDESIKRLSPSERADIGRQLRAEVPRSSHAGFERPSGAPNPIALLEGQAQSRVAELIPIRYGRMLASPFSYFRGAALPMAHDLASTPLTGLAVQSCGDAHCGNFGLFGSAERRLVFDINDFDETQPGPWEWDVKRLAASLEISARENGIGRKQRSAIVRAAVGRYRMAMRDFAPMTNLQVWYAAADLAEVQRLLQGKLTQRQQENLAREASKATTRDSHQMLDKLTTTVDGRLRIVANPPLITPLSSLLPADADRHAIHAILNRAVAGYRRSLPGDRRYLLDQYEYELADIARKVVGVGSVGTRCWIMLLRGRDTGDPLFLQMKEAEASVLAEFVGPSAFQNEGQRVVEGQRLMQAASDIFLGWHRQRITLDSKVRDFYIRQLRDWKFSFDTAAMIPTGLAAYGEVCGWTLARAHARSGDRIAIATYLGGSDSFDRAVADFAAAYADQNERDYAALDKAATVGEVLAHRGV
jgi:uncharacterized protein (DUF2252 family)